MALAPAQGQSGQQALQARLDDPLVSEDFRGEIRDMNDYIALSAVFTAQRKQGHDVAPLSQDPDKNFPDNDPVKQKQLVGRLFEAMRNQIDIIDGTVKKDKNKQVIRDVNGRPVMRETGTIRRTRDETNIRLELLAWSLMLGIRDAQLGALYALLWPRDRNFEFQHFESFLDRFNAVVESINVSKKAVADLMEPSWICRLANAPDHEVQRKKGNARGNKNKQTLLEEAAAKRKRDREEQDDQEDGEGNQEGALHNTPDTPGTPAAPVTPARQATRKTASRNARKQPKRSASDTPRRAAANTQPPRAPPSGQFSTPATPQGFTRQAAVAPQMTMNNFQPSSVVGRMGIEGPDVNPANQFFGPTNNWTPSVGATSYHLAQPQTASVSSQGPPQGFALHQPRHPQQPFSQNTLGQAFNFNPSVLGSPLSPAYGNNFRFLPQANTFGAQSMPQTMSSPGTMQSLNNTPGHISTAPTSPFSSAPQTPWSSDTPNFTRQLDLGSALDNQQFAGVWDPPLECWDDENPQYDFS